MMKKFHIVEDSKKKIVKSPDYNYVFDKETGFFARWGKTRNDDPDFAPSGEILDLEVTTSCQGVTGLNGKKNLCKFCYKANNPNGKNMSFETFKKVFNKVNESKILCQIAFGVDSQAKSNPDLFKMMHYCRDNGVIPNVTVAELDDETADKLAAVCGAVAVSRYENKDICYETVKKLTDRGLKQTNIHVLIAEESYDMAMETLKDRLTDDRLKDLNAIVMLSLKKKGRGKVGFNNLSCEHFQSLIDFALEKNISFGLDSCGCANFLNSVRNHSNFENFKIVSEPCESSLFSTYISVDASFFPCSFSEGEGEWVEGIDVANCNNFVKDVWWHPKTIKFRRALLETVKHNDLGCRECPLFKV